MAFVGHTLSSLLCQLSWRFAGFLGLFLSSGLITAASPERGLRDTDLRTLCEEVLGAESHPSLSDREIVIKEVMRDRRSPDYMTESVPTLSTHQMENAVTLKRVSHAWASGYTPPESPTAIQGDPRANFTLFYENTAQFLGIRRLSEREIQYPDLTTLNDRIALLSKHLEDLGFEPLLISYYEQNMENDSLSEYIERFTGQFQVPLANPSTAPMHFVHDVNFHLSALALPNEYLKHLQSTLVMGRELKNYVKAHRSELNGIYDHEDQLEWLDRLMAGDIDVGTGQIVIIPSLEIRFFDDYEATFDYWGRVAWIYYENTRNALLGSRITSKIEDIDKKLGGRFLNDLDASRNHDFEAIKAFQVEDTASEHKLRQRIGERLRELELAAERALDAFTGK